MPQTASLEGVSSAGIVRPLQRGLAVLRAMSQPGSERARPGDLVRATGLARSTVDRVTATLEHLGYVRSDGPEFVLAPSLMELGNAYLSASGLSDALAPRVDELADTFDESVSLAVSDGPDVRFIAQATRRRTMSLAFRIGDALPAERCAPGALFAACWGERGWTAWRARKERDPLDEGFPALPPPPGHGAAGTEPDFRRRSARAGRDGWSLDDQLIEPGLIAATVPVRGPGSVGSPGSRTACALSVVSHTSRHDVRGLAARCLPALREAADGMETVLAAGQRPGTAALLPRRSRPPRTYEEEGRGILRSLARGLAVLRALGAARGGGLSLSAVAGGAGLPRATVRRALLTLESLGYVSSGDGLFRPLPRVLELGYAHLSGLSSADLVQPHLRELVDRVHQSASVTVLDGTDIQYMARVHTRRVMSVNIVPGTRFPAYATAMGRVLLADLPTGERDRVLARSRPRALTSHTVTSAAELAALVEEAGRAGHAVVDQELEQGLRSVAVPLRDADGRAVAALNVAQHSGSEPAEETRHALLPLLQRTARTMEADLRTAARHHRLRIP